MRVRFHHHDPFAVPACDRIRPQAVGAAWLPQFLAVAPAAWSERVVLGQLFKCCDMERNGWTDRNTELDDLGGNGSTRRWRVRRVSA